MAVRIGVDTGGTFTDLVLEDGEGNVARAKVPSTPAAPTEAIIDGLGVLLEAAGDLPISAVESLVHGTTVGTNAVIQEAWARAALVTTAGFRDVIEIRRQVRPDVYDLRVPKPHPIASRELRVEVPERVRADGTIHTPLDEEVLRHAVAALLDAGVDAIAVCFLHSYAHPEHETRAVEIILDAAPGMYVSASHAVAAEFREYPRVSTTIMNAGLGPLMRGYLDALTEQTRALGLKVEPRVMHSNGGIASPAATARFPVHTLASGPVAGVIGATRAASQRGLANLVTFDVGGTSTDVCLVEDGNPVTTSEKVIDGRPIRGAMVDVHSIGAGGGSLAWIDAGGFLQVGPRSAGAIPGPACYGRGGVSATVTDASVVLGRLGINLLGGRMTLDYDAACDAVRADVADPLGIDVIDASEAILRVANANMARAIRLVSIERGHDPRDFVLVAFGGAGSLHVVDVGREVGFHTALIPDTPGLLSARGLLTSPMRRDFARTFLFDLSGELDRVEEAYRALEQDAFMWLMQEAPGETHRVSRHVDLRYVGQSFETMVPVPDGPLTHSIPKLLDDFYREYGRKFGTAPEAPVEGVTLRVTGAVPIREAAALERESESEFGNPQAHDTRDVHFEAAGFVRTPVYDRSTFTGVGRLDGPLVIEQHDSTAVIPPGSAIEWDDTGAIVVSLRVDSEGGHRA